MRKDSVNRAFRWLLSLTLLLFVSVAVSAAEGLLRHGPYLQEVTEHGATVCFELAQGDYIAWVEVRQQSADGVAAPAKTFYQLRQGFRKSWGNRFAVRLDSLLANATYDYRIHYQPLLTHLPYRVERGTEAVSPWYHFRTLDPKATEHHLFITSDMHNRPQLLAQFLRQLDYQTCDHIIFNGDMLDYMQWGDPTYGKPEHPYPAFVDTCVSLFATHQDFAIVRGNHETRGNKASQFLQFFPRRNGKVYQAYRWGDLMVLLLDCGEDKADADENYYGLVSFDDYRAREARWLQRVLRSDAFQSARYRIVVCHFSAPGYDMAGWHGQEDFHRRFLPLLRNAGIDLWVTGHAHPQKALELPKGYQHSGSTYPVIVEGYYSSTRIDISEGKIRVKAVGEDGSVQLQKTYKTNRK